MNPWLIEANHLSKRYGSHLPWAVNDLSFSIGLGEIVGLIGENGAGKSTLLRMLSTMLTPTKGVVKVAGFHTVEQAKEARASLGILFTQQSGLYERLTGRENILYFADLNGLSRRTAQKRLDEVSEILNLREFLGNRASTYSTGMAQRTLIARTIIHDPKMLMLDEPTTGLDVTSTRGVHDFIRWCKETGKSVLFSSHLLGAVESLSDRVMILNKGNTLAFDSPENLCGSNGLEEAFFKLKEARSE